jgi:hypothetical protein
MGEAVAEFVVAIEDEPLLGGEVDGLLIAVLAERRSCGVRVGLEGCR